MTLILGPTLAPSDDLYLNITLDTGKHQHDCYLA